MNRVTRVLFAAATVFTVSACASALRSQFANPVVELKDIRLRGIGLQGGSFDLVLEVCNVKSGHIIVIISSVDVPTQI